MMTIKQYMLLCEVYKNGGDKEISFVTKPDYDPLEDKGYLTVYYELGAWRVSITDLGVSIAKRLRIITSVTRFAFMVVAIMAIACLFCSCKTIESTTSADSNHSTYSNESSVKERKDSVVYRDSIRYIERTINDTVYKDKEVIRFIERNHFYHDTVYKVCVDTMFVTMKEKEVITKEPSFWEKIGSIKWLIILIAGYAAYRIIKKFL